MDAVLGLSVTPSAVGLVLVEGQGADGATVDREAIEILPTRRSSPRHASDEAAATVLRTEALATGRGLRLHTIGVTWSDDAQTEASLLLRSLRECGFDNVVAVQLPEASEAVAWGVAELLGNEVTAVCVIEYDAVIALVVNTREGAVQTAVNHSVDSEESLIRWLNAVFTRADWRPEALVLVGSGADLDAIMPRLEAVLSVPVFAPAEAELALARGAALAAADSGTSVFAAEEALDRAGEQRRRQPAHAGPLAMLAAGTVTFVVSVSAAISMQLTPGKDTTPAEPTPAAKSSPDIAAAPAPQPAASPLPAAPRRHHRPRSRHHPKSRRSPSSTFPRWRRIRCLPSRHPKHRSRCRGRPRCHRNRWLPDWYLPSPPRYPNAEDGCNGSGTGSRTPATTPHRYSRPLRPSTPRWLHRRGHRSRRHRPIPPHPRHRNPPHCRLRDSLTLVCWRM
ncbi:hypothetical protein M4D79_08660 [Mycolicibacterium novocastrense]|nr:hypothetical protein M4D79_08660 [Mycolicibacterium novocastrense]